MKYLILILSLMFISSCTYAEPIISTGKEKRVILPNFLRLCYNSRVALFMKDSKKKNSYVLYYVSNLYCTEV